MSLTAADLIAFEDEMADLFNAGRIKAPLHLAGGNEQNLIDLFATIRRHADAQAERARADERKLWNEAAYAEADSDTWSAVQARVNADRASRGEGEK